ncbi:MAG: carboxypeptidase-like regulatory domain-containing protein [Elainellaceae cyanobacterium]
MLFEKRERPPLRLSFCLTVGLFLFLSRPATAETNSSHQDVFSTSATTPDTPAALEDFVTFPVGLGVDGRIVVNSALIRGFEDGAQAIAFEDWLIPFDTVTRALNIAVTPLEDGQWELRSPGLVARVNPEDLQRDSTLGLVLSIAEIQTLLGVEAKFDLLDYAVMFDPPWSSAQRASAQRREAVPIVTEGLPQVSPEPFTISFAGHRLDATGGSDRTTTARNTSTLLGTLLSGSWFLQLNQESLSDLSSWRIREAQYLLETDSADYAVGSQPTFWRSQGTGSYWGLTTLQRRSYDPRISLGSGGFSPTARLQADNVGRDVAGEAPPGSVVQLVQGARTNIIAETFVDSTGVYRFNQVPQGGLYEVLVYPNGQLMAQPEVRTVSFSTVPASLPQGASALIASAGLRQQPDNSLFGGFGRFSGGAAYRQGVSDELTLGAGMLYDEEISGLAELFYQSSTLPIQLAASARVGAEDDPIIDADFVYQPSSDFRLDLNADELSSSFRANWQIFSNLGLRATGNTRDETFGVGFTGYFNRADLYSLASIDYLTNGNFRWNGLIRYNRIELTSRGNEVGSSSNLLFRLSEGHAFTEGHFLRMGYETRVAADAGSLLRLGWRYQSKPRAADGRYLWAIDAGYGIGAEGHGPIASLETAIVPGLVLRARYEEVSALSGESAFAIEVSPFYNLQANLRSDDSRYQHLRRQGGLWIQPFIDTNGNGILDGPENVFVDNAALLIVLNNQSLERFQPDIHASGVLVRTTPGTHRVDLDPAGYPLELKPSQTNYAVEVAAGSYTPVLIPFMVRYTIAGVVTNESGQPIKNATVEVIPTGGGAPITAVTNDAGVYYLEELERGSYSIQINQQIAHPQELAIDDRSEPFQELNITF